MAKLPEKDLLIIESDPEALTLLELIFNYEHLACDYSVSGARALTFINTYRYRLILIDTKVSDIESRELVVAIKRVHRQSKIIALSVSPDNRQQYLLLGALDVVAKPISRKALVEIVRQYVDERRYTARLPLLLPVRAPGLVNGVTINVSSDGILLQSETPLHEHSVIDLVITPPGDAAHIHTQARVIRVTKQKSLYVSALYFMDTIAAHILENIVFFIF